ncbi:partial GDP-perosamine synthase, partial [Candidatus Brocadiaceae bacterium]
HSQSIYLSELSAFCDMNSFNDLYQNAFAKSLGVNKAFSFWKGRVALYAILKALDIGTHDEVILPGFTCVVVPNAVLYCGATPIYADIDPNTFSLAPVLFEQAITARTKAVIVQHTFGIPAEMDTLLAIARKHHVAVIEDCAHAIGSEYEGKLLGTFGDAAFFSFQWSKPYSTGLGGMAVTNDPLLGERITSIQNSFVQPDWIEIRKLELQVFVYEHFFSPSFYWTAMNSLRSLSQLGLFIGSSDQDELNCKMPSGYDKRMSPFQARKGLPKLEHIQAGIDHRRHVVAEYQRLLGQRGWLIPCPLANTTPVYLRYPMLVDNKQELLGQAKKEQIEIGSWFESVVHPRGSPLESANYKVGQCPIAESVVERVINLPTHPRVTDREIQRIIDFLVASSAPAVM